MTRGRSHARRTAALLRRAAVPLQVVTRYETVLAFAAALILLATVPGDQAAAQQQASPTEELRDLENRRQDVENELQRLQQDLNQMRGELQEGQAIVSGFNAIVQNYNNYLEALVGRYDACLRLELQADALRKEKNPMAPRFEARAAECAAEVKSDEIMSGVYENVFDRIKRDVGSIKNGLDAIEAGIDSTIARQRVRQNERDLIQNLINGAQQTDTYIEPFRGN